MPKLSEIVNCDVICLNDGALRGKVANVYFDENCRKIVYFDLTCAEGNVLLPFVAAACVRDAVTTENALPFLAHGDADLTPLLSSPLGKKVYTASGRARGKVTELLFSAKGKVTALETETSSYSPSAFAVFGDVLILKEGRNGKRRSPSAVFPEPKEDYPVAVLRDDSPSPSLSSPPQSAAAANAPRSGADIRAAEAEKEGGVYLTDASGGAEVLYGQEEFTPYRVIADYNFLLGRTLSDDLISYSGEKLASRGDRVTVEVVEKARRGGKLMDLTLSSR